MKPGIDHIGLGVGVIIVKDGKILLVRRKKPRDEWSIPGGKVELKEKLRDTAVREIKEELGIDIKVGEMVKVAETFEDDTHWISIAYLGDIIKGEPKCLDPDHSEIKWFDLSKLPERQFLPSKLAIEEYLKNENK